MKSLATRTATAIGFVVIVVGAIWAGLYTYAALFLIVQCLALYELFKLNGSSGGRPTLVSLWIASTAIFFTFLLVSLGQIPLYFVALVMPLFLFSAISGIVSGAPNPLLRVATAITGLVFICLPLGVMHVVVVSPDYFDSWLLIGILILIWVYDASAYIFGSLLGRIKLAPRISPLKTVEGVIGGALMCALAAWGVSAWIWRFPLAEWLAFAAIVVVFGTMGDLLESMLKRHSGVKDSGALLPGHGGILDRFDNFFFSIPVIAIYILLR